VSISVSEIFVILLVALIVIKPEKLPEVALILGRGLKWIRGAIANIKKEFK